MKSEEIYNEFDYLLDLIREEMKSLTDSSIEFITYLKTVSALMNLRDGLPEEKEYTIDLQSFIISAYSKEQAKAKAIEMLKTGEETAAIDNVIEGNQLQFFSEVEGPVAT